ncbi:MAG TPA: hypothetical protein VFA53_04820 [Xanthobacteraceae bacterium]|nr:hypothetical protein [Xanthobacteraceae bacterium]
MGRNARRFLLLLSGFALAACSAFTPKKEPEVDPNLFPTSYRSEVATTLHKVLGDFVHVRAATISDPVLTQVETVQRYTLCVRVDWRNIANNASGTGDRIAYFYGGHLSQLIDVAGNECSKVAYKPFPELVALNPPG